MKICITSQGQKLNSLVDPRFGRAKFFVVLDTETDEYTSMDNSQNLNAAQGAGIQAAKNAIDLDVTAVVTGNIGPKAFATLNAGDVEAYTGASGTVSDALEQFKAGKLQQADGANVKAHWM